MLDTGGEDIRPDLTPATATPAPPCRDAEVPNDDIEGMLFIDEGTIAVPLAVGDLGCCTIDIEPGGLRDTMWAPLCTMRAEPWTRAAVGGKP
mmetsp:Transcript_102866/g.295231  ORF Transcript_102866/g.295231 Transcript_102866/m.295231 type:complete len:92 (+) Transcript_102866:1055-1330(+)